MKIVLLDKSLVIERPIEFDYRSLGNRTFNCVQLVKFYCEFDKVWLSSVIERLLFDWVRIPNCSISYTRIKTEEMNCLSPSEYSCIAWLVVNCVPKCKLGLIFFNEQLATRKPWVLAHWCHTSSIATRTHLAMKLVTSTIESYCSLHVDTLLPTWTGYVPCTSFCTGRDPRWQHSWKKVEVGQRHYTRRNTKDDRWRTKDQYERSKELLHGSTWRKKTKQQMYERKNKLEGKLN